ncbi:MAG: glycosyltransferase family 4 protein [bacterium]|nr:glycosyltransferase family 4 protein [bacterium]
MVDNIVNDEAPDFIHIDHLQMAQYVENCNKSKKILDEHNVESFIISRISIMERNPLRKIFTRLESKSLEEFEKKAVLGSNMVLTVSEVDRKTLIDLTGEKEKIRAIPIGVDIEYFYYKPLKNNNSNTVVFIGTLYWPPNIDAVRWFYEQVWKNIRKDISDLKWKIVGLNPVEEVLKLPVMDKNIEVHGSVDDIRPFMWGEGIFTVPLFSGSGMRVKILNAMSCGIPVISTTIGAEGIEGLVPVNTSTIQDYNIWIADSPEDFASAITNLLKNNDLREQLSRNGRKLMEEKYSWEIQGEKLLKVYEEIINLRLGHLKKKTGAF